MDYIPENWENFYKYGRRKINNMFHKYFKFTRKRIAFFCILMISILGLQYFLTGSLASLQQVTTEAGNSNSAVIGILPDTEVIRQKFCFDRRVVLNSFSVSFGSFKKDKVGDTLHIQVMDGNNDVVFSEDVDVKDITPNAEFVVNMDHAVVIPKGVTCCIRMTCSSADTPYALIPTVNTTNRTDPNTYMSTLKMQTHAKSMNISYSYSYRQLFPMILFILEIIILFVIIFERMTEYSVRYYKQRRKEIKHSKKLKRTTRRSPRNFVKWILSDPSVLLTVRILIAIMNPLFLASMLEMMNGTFLTIMPNVWIFTWILLGAIQLLCTALIGNAGIAMLAMDLILFPIGLANLFIMNVRGTPFLPADILGVATATEVASTYTFSLTPAQFVVLPAFAIWCILIYRTRWKRHKHTIRKKLIRFASTVVPGIAIICILYNTDILPACGIQDNVWNKVSSCKANGFYMNYFINFHYLKVSTPSGYSEDKVAEILDNTGSGQDTQTGQAASSGTTSVKQEDGKGILQDMATNASFQSNTSLSGKKPNIILIMNESLADFSLVGDTRYNMDPLPFIHSLKKNTIKGRDYVSVFGAGTSNSEFEAMTGNTMAFFPSGCNVYQQFMHDSTFSLPSYLKEMGYSCKAVHPSSGANWNRVATYKSMKFDDFITIDNFKKPEYVRYISDKESYKKVIELYEKKGDKPLYLFDMTIQNHGGYLTNTNWKTPVYVEGAYYTEAKEYLSATHVSDQAFQYLINYFSKQTEPTIICMFGDHFPSIETSFYEELLGKSQSDWDLEDIQKRYAVPFIMWANYDIQEEQNAVISNNYLENMILKQAGLELPLYNQYLEKLSADIPAMNVNGYMDASGKWHNYGSDETDTVKNLLDDYEILQYGYYSDMDKDKMSELFNMKH